MVSTSSRVWINRVRKITNPARDQLGQEKWILSCLRSHLRIWSRKTSSAVPSRVSPLILHTQTKFGAYLRDYSRASHDDGVHTYRLPSSTAVGLSGSSNCVPMAFTAESPPAQGQCTSSSSNGCCFFRFHAWTDLCAPLFLRTHY
ncbi:unnamed protein product [Ascophyllum nodosum]